MQNQDIETVKDTVRQTIAAGTMFTAYDITVSLRKTGMWLKHEDSKQIIHDMFRNDEMDGYEKQTIILASSNSEAILYLPEGEDVRLYHSNITGAQAAGLSYVNPSRVSVAPTGAASPRYGSAVIQTAAPAVLSTSSGARWSASQGTKQVDKKLRLRIPAQILRDAGFVAKDRAYVSVDPISEIITISRTSNGNGNKPHIIDQYANLRVGLKKAGVGASMFSFSASPNSVVATPK